MQSIELVRVFVFCLFVLAVYTAALLAVISAIRKRRAPSRRGWVAIGLAAAGGVCMLYGFFVEPYWLETAHVPLSSPKLTRALRIAHISDLHCDPQPRLEEELPGAIEKEHPDAIVFTGDALNAREGLPVLKKLLARLPAIAPTFAVRGNWDVGGGGQAWSDPEEIELRKDMFSGVGVRELDGDAVPIRSDVWVSGVSESSHSKIEETLARVPAGAFSIFLCHRPDEIDYALRGHADLYLAGHTHGGQVALPFYGALVTFSRYGKRFESGLFRVEDTWLYVNRGIGMDGLGAPRCRFCARPELTILELGR